MAREIVIVNTQVGNLPIEVKVVDIPIIEDLFRQMIVESAFARKIQEPISRVSPIGRDIKDFLIKVTVAD